MADFDRRLCSPEIQTALSIFIHSDDDLEYQYHYEDEDELDFTQPQLSQRSPREPPRMIAYVLLQVIQLLARVKRLADRDGTLDALGVESCQEMVDRLTEFAGHDIFLASEEARDMVFEVMERYKQAAFGFGFQSQNHIHRHDISLQSLDRLSEPRTTLLQQWLSSIQSDARDRQFVPHELAGEVLSSTFEPHVLITMAWIWLDSRLPAVSYEELGYLLDAWYDEVNVRVNALTSLRDAPHRDLWIALEGLRRNLPDLSSRAQELVSDPGGGEVEQENGDEQLVYMSRLHRLAGLWCGNKPLPKSEVDPGRKYWVERVRREQQRSSGWGWEHLGVSEWLSEPLLMDLYDEMSSREHEVESTGRQYQGRIGSKNELDEYVRGWVAKFSGVKLLQQDHLA